MLTLPPLRDVIARHGLNAKKSLGQNFLFDGNLLDRIARVPGPLTGATVYEVGPGPGGLTRALLRAGARVIAVERDSRALPALAELAEAAGNGSNGPRLTVIAGDAMAVDAATVAGNGAHIVANLPYNIGTALLTGWLGAEAWPPWWASLTLMFQKEVAQRLVAVPGSSAYGRLSVLAQWRTSARIAFTVPPRAFIPAPKVDSAVVHLVPTAPMAAASAARLSALTAAAFGQRRKMLRASLKAMPGALDAMVAQGISAEARAETVPVAAFASAAALLA
ncbi:16S rRNA (adenine(1518)-N(6)/adenine(1519)-N(6))-dimethyltransferase RsmA [Polymorphobacter fuscus]|uniref:Ribosomal RNA small subunit methyltransferase A n=1 Tax=Sandarakinorhabdus fusca TaxID=1439888 RepID=A0A7C9KVK2_9SPHN|nr:16S rRNA (adenine(1518)-N(6)/adenine(1519)-N(6))-dimethyltransferase RsmA [Polymorphobacter fuscus]KAB7649091.1 16S rRNA (adenine(1518)-N(6)/adenine(1519)-N(6))-dimethyltransferase RsmA [Polymorphobacter fuscus]MQT16285.1 16S rRNA (adenine(1518)-N(6)/adenine(1519)-N(6))-dimethyltransferase RsmA [Polymorphobacter fuscus]